MGNSIHSGHRNRVKNRFRLEGLDGFEDHEVIELLLYYSTPMKDTNELAHKMLHEFGTISGLFEADPTDIQKRCGVSENTATLVTLVPSLARRYFHRKWGDKPVLDSSYKAGKYSVTLFTGRTYEAFYTICLDSQNRVNHPVLVHEGTLNEAPVYPRIIVEAALRHQANSVILAHNHPGGSTQPSAADMDVTRKIKAALEVISVRVNDHIIVAGDNYISFAEKGLL